VSRPGLLSLLLWPFGFVVGAILHCRVFSGLPHLHPHSNASPVWQPKMSPVIAKCPQEVKFPPVEITISLGGEIEGRSKGTKLTPWRTSPWSWGNSCFIGCAVKWKSIRQRTDGSSREQSALAIGWVGSIWDQSLPSVKVTLISPEAIQEGCPGGLWVRPFDPC
jgi:hypothetical protein